MKTDDKDREGGDSHGAIGAKLMEYALKVRKVFVTGGVDEKMAKDVVQQLHILASISDDPIYMFVNSPGGHVESGDMIFDAIRFITPKVIMIGSGSVASAGALIYAAADKENRYSLPNTRFLLHQPSGGIQGPASNIEIYRRESADEGTPRPDLRRSHRADAGKDQCRHRARLLAERGGGRAVRPGQQDHRFGTGDHAAWPVSFRRPDKYEGGREERISRFSSRSLFFL